MQQFLVRQENKRHLKLESNISGVKYSKWPSLAPNELKWSSFRSQFEIQYLLPEDIIKFSAKEK